MTAHSVPIQEQKQQLGFSAEHLWLCTASREMLCQGGIGNYNCCGTDGSWSCTRKIPTPSLCRVFLGFHPGAAKQKPLPVSSPGFGGFPASLLFGTSFGGLIVATAVPQIQGLAPLITSIGSGVSSSRKSRSSSRRVPSQGRVYTHLWKCKAPWARRGAVPQQNGVTGIKNYLRCKPTSPNSHKLNSSPGVSVPPAVCASGMSRLGWEGLGSTSIKTT